MVMNKKQPSKKKNPQKTLQSIRKNPLPLSAEGINLFLIKLLEIYRK